VLLKVLAGANVVGPSLHVQTNQNLKRFAAGIPTLAKRARVGSPAMVLAFRHGNFQVPRKSPPRLYGIHNDRLS